MSTYGAAAAKSQKRQGAVLVQQRRRSPTVSETMPVTLEAAENEPIFSGRSAYFSSCGAQLVEVDVAVGVLRGS